MNRADEQGQGPSIRQPQFTLGEGMRTILQLSFDEQRAQGVFAYGFPDERNT